MIETMPKNEFWDGREKSANGNKKRWAKPLLVVLLFLISNAISFFIGAGVIVNRTTNSCDLRKDLTRDNFLILINEYRLENNLPIFKTVVDLDNYAQFRANEMFTNQVMTHTTKASFSNWQKENGDKLIKFSSIGENIGSRTDSACGMMEAWKSSPTHNLNLLSKEYQFIGIAVEGDFIAIELGEPEK
ncbi:MAG: Cysteine-rich secretory protein family protein [bacterium ADurb.Bin212]|nr:MAG: Cysteine-rich secretory protein family protein [bacterium ADurb.Bin212]